MAALAAKKVGVSGSGIISKIQGGTEIEGRALEISLSLPHISVVRRGGATYVTFENENLLTIDEENED